MNLKMMKKFPNFKPHSDAETEELLSLLFRKLDVDELIFLLRVLQRDIREKYTLTKITKKNCQFKVRFINFCVKLLKNMYKIGDHNANIR